MKVFISQPMNGRTNEEIKKERKYIKNILTNKYPNEGEFEIIDSFFENAPHDTKPLWYLAKSLELMSTADLVVFAPNWERYRSCKIEHACAVEYGFKIMNLQ